MTTMIANIMWISAPSRHRNVLLPFYWRTTASPTSNAKLLQKRLRTSCDYQPNANDDQPDAKVPCALFVDTECKSAAASEVPWEHCRTRMEVGGWWWTWNEGIADIRYHFHPYGSTNLSEGVQLRSTVRRINWVLGKRDSHFKIGIVIFGLINNCRRI